MVEVLGRATVGLSQETWFVRVTTDAGDVEAVLRLPTPASGVRAIVTQRTALQAVAGTGVPAPDLLWFDDGDQNPLSRPFIVMTRVPGTVPVGWHELPEPARTYLAEQAIDALAALHDVDPAPLGKPVTPGFDFERLERRLDRVGPLPPVVTGALAWLSRRIPDPPAQPAIVHGDFRMGNLVVDGDRLTGVLDWEMAAPGDPLSDLGWCFIPVWEPPGIDEQALVRRYAERSGASVDPERLHWHRVLGYVRLAYYALAGTRAFDSGRSDDFRLAALRLQLPVTLDRLAATLAGDPVV
jgi:aminoglycoside phosphotransferase (APT) family kinase protein